ncbi:MAG: nucleotidyltransferase domain-containing protein [Aquificota bacterium]
MKEVKKIIEMIKDYPKVEAIYLFGSYAKGKPISDDMVNLVKNMKNFVKFCK